MLDNAFLAVVVAAHRFGVRVRPELDPGEMMPVIESVPTGHVPSGNELDPSDERPVPRKSLAGYRRCDQRITAVWDWNRSPSPQSWKARA